MTLNEIIYDIREKLKLGSDDIDISDEYLAHLIDIKRGLLIHQRFEKHNKPIPEEFKQTICLELEEVPSGKDICFSTVMRTIKEIPAYLNAYRLIRTQDLRATSFNLIDEDRVAYLGHNRWLSKQQYTTINENKFLFYSNEEELKLLESVKFTSIFVSPEQADELTCTDSPGFSNCEYFDKKYPITPSVASDIVNMIIKELAPSLQLPDDTVNNSSESPR